MEHKKKGWAQVWVWELDDIQMNAGTHHLFHSYNEKVSLASPPPTAYCQGWDWDIWRGNPLADRTQRKTKLWEKKDSIEIWEGWGDTQVLSVIFTSCQISSFLKFPLLTAGRRRGLNSLLSRSSWSYWLWLCSYSHVQPPQDSRNNCSTWARGGKEGEGGAWRKWRARYQGLAFGAT